jgi:ABC-type multidrug transport system ATPase subunit
VPRLLIDRLRKHFGAVEALREATLHVHAGEILGIIGPNGAGKTTLLECIAGLVAPDGGEVRDEADRRVSSGTRRGLLLYLRDGIVPWPDQPTEWVLDFAAAVFEGRADWRDELASVLGLDELRGRRVGALSKGQRKRVLLALALAAPQPVLLMDEPFDGLDLRQTREVIHLFRRVAGQGRSLVLSIHSMTDAMRVCDRLVLLSDGRTVAEGTLDELRTYAGMASADLEDVFLALT